VEQSGGIPIGNFTARHGNFKGNFLQLEKAKIDLMFCSFRSCTYCRSILPVSQYLCTSNICKVKTNLYLSMFTDVHFCFSKENFNPDHAKKFEIVDPWFFLHHTEGIS